MREREVAVVLYEVHGQSTLAGSQPGRGRTNCRCAWQGDNFASVERAAAAAPQAGGGCSKAGRRGQEG